jgi:hypothetical protein
MIFFFLPSSLLGSRSTPGNPAPEATADPKHTMNPAHPIDIRIDRDYFIYKFGIILHEIHLLSTWS